MVAARSYSERPHYTPRQSELLTPLAYFSLIYLTTVYVTQQVLASLAGPENNSKEVPIPPYVRDGAIIWPDGCDKYFVPEVGKRTTQLRRKSDSDRVIGELIRDASSSLLDVASSFEELREIEASPLIYIKHVLELVTAQAGSDGSGCSASEALEKCDIQIPTLAKNAHSALPPNVVISFDPKLSQKGRWTQAESQRLKKSIKERTLQFLESMRNYLLVKFSLEDIEIPGLPGISMSSASLLELRLSELNSANSAEWSFAGLFQVIREARGVVTSDPADVNIIVRDLLWIRPLEVAPSENIVIADLPVSSSEHGRRLGIYYSAFDELVYEIQYIVIRNDVLSLEAVALRDNVDDRKSLSLHMPKMQALRTGDFSLGTLMGATSNQTNTQKRSGAWSAIIVRPFENDYLHKIDTVLSMYLDHLSEVSRDEYNHKISRFSNYVSRLHYSGVLYSKMLSEGAAPDGKKDVVFENLRNFRRFFKIPEQYGRNVDSALDRILGRCRNAANLEESAVREALLELVEEQSCFAISPISVLNRGVSKQEEQELRTAASFLSNRKNAIFVNRPQYRVYLDAR